MWLFLTLQSRARVFSVVRCPFHTSETRPRCRRATEVFRCAPFCSRRLQWVLQRNTYLQRSDGKDSGKFGDVLSIQTYYYIISYLMLSYILSYTTLYYIMIFIWYDNDNDKDNDRQYDNMTVWHGHGTTSKCANSMWWRLPSNQTNPSLQSVLWITEMLIKSNKHNIRIASYKL